MIIKSLEVTDKGNQEWAVAHVLLFLGSSQLEHSLALPSAFRTLSYDKLEIQIRYMVREQLAECARQFLQD